MKHRSSGGEFWRYGKIIGHCTVVKYSIESFSPPINTLGNIKPTRIGDERTTCTIELDDVRFTHGWRAPSKHALWPYFRDVELRYSSMCFKDLRVMERNTIKMGVVESWVVQSNEIQYDRSPNGLERAKELAINRQKEK